MCLVLPSRVLAVADDQAEIEMPNGVHACVAITLVPEVSPGDYVLVDRGLALKIIDAAEAQEILELYAEMDALTLDTQPDPAPWSTPAAHD